MTALDDYRAAIRGAGGCVRTSNCRIDPAQPWPFLASAARSAATLDGLRRVNAVRRSQKLPLQYRQAAGKLLRFPDWSCHVLARNHHPDHARDGLLMAPSFAIPKLLDRHGLAFEDIDLWEIHEAFTAQALANIAALEKPGWIAEKTGIERDFGRFPRERVNPNGGSVAIGHPFAATGARDLSQAVKELWAMPVGARAIVSVCADGGQGTVALLERV